MAEGLAALGVFVVVVISLMATIAITVVVRRRKLNPSPSQEDLISQAQKELEEVNKYINNLQEGD